MICFVLVFVVTIIIRNAALDGKLHNGDETPLLFGFWIMKHAHNLAYILSTLGLKRNA